MALALVEAGARAVYCVDLPKTPGEEWEKTKLYAQKMEGKAGEGRLEYIHANVADQASDFCFIFVTISFEVDINIVVFSVGSYVEDW